MKRVFQPEWRTQSRAKRRFYARYMGWIERGGYFVVLCVIAAFIFAFNYPVEDVIKADNVAIRPLTVPLISDQPAMVARALVDDYSEVTQGQPLVEVVEGDQNIKLFQQYRIAQELQRTGVSLPANLIFDPPKTRTILASSAGTFRVSNSTDVIPSGETIGEVMDYGQLIAEAELEGTTVAKAAMNQKAKISGIIMGTEAGILFRGSSNEADLVSGAILGQETLNLLESELKGKSVRARDDLVLEIESVKNVQIDSHVEVGAGSSGNPTVQLDPALNYSLTGAVLEGYSIGTVQIASLPKELSDATTKALESGLTSRNYMTVDGKAVSVTAVRDAKYVLQLGARGVAEGGGAPLPATVISRKFVAKVAVKSPPKFLVEAIRAADRNGKSVTARVEVVTGTRPIAFILLKKS